MRALVTGAAGQDGTILCTQLSRQGTRVIGLVKPGTDTSLLQRYVPDVEVVEEPLVVGADDGRPPEQLHDVRHGLVSFPSANRPLAHSQQRSDLRLMH